MLLRPNVDDGDTEFSLDGSVTAGGGRLGCRCSRLRFALIKQMKSNIQIYRWGGGKFNNTF